MSDFQGSNLLTLAGTLYNFSRQGRDLRRNAGLSKQALKDENSILDRTLAEEDRRLAKAEKRLMKAHRQRLSRAFTGFRTANPQSRANPAVSGFLASVRSKGK